MDRCNDKKPTDSVFDGAGPFKDLFTGVIRDLYTANFADRCEARDSLQLGQGMAVFGRDNRDVEAAYAHVLKA